MEEYVELGRELHSTGLTHKLFKKSFVALLHVSAQSEPEVENILRDIALEISITAPTIIFMLMVSLDVHCKVPAPDFFF